MPPPSFAPPSSAPPSAPLHQSAALMQRVVENADVLMTVRHQQGLGPRPPKLAAALEGAWHCGEKDLVRCATLAQVAIEATCPWSGSERPLRMCFLPPSASAEQIKTVVLSSLLSCQVLEEARTRRSSQPISSVAIEHTAPPERLRAARGGETEGSWCTVGDDAQVMSGMYEGRVGRVVQTTDRSCRLRLFGDDDVNTGFIQQSQLDVFPKIPYRATLGDATVCAFRRNGRRVTVRDAAGGEREIDEASIAPVRAASAHVVLIELSRAAEWSARWKVVVAALKLASAQIAKRLPEGGTPPTLVCELFLMRELLLDLAKHELVSSFHAVRPDGWASLGVVAAGRAASPRDPPYRAYLGGRTVLVLRRTADAQLEVLHEDDGSTVVVDDAPKVRPVPLPLIGADTLPAIRCSDPMVRYLGVGFVRVLFGRGGRVKVSLPHGRLIVCLRTPHPTAGRATTLRYMSGSSHATTTVGAPPGEEEDEEDVSESADDASEGDGVHDDTVDFTPGADDEY